MLFNSIGIALSGVKTTQTLLNTATRNVTNAQTEGYVAKRQSYRTMLYSGGVRATDIRRELDEAYVFRLRTNLGALNYQTTHSRKLTEIDVINGDPAQGSTIGAGIERLAASFQKLSAQPTDYNTSAAVFAEADRLVQTFNSQTSQLLKIQQDSRREMTDLVTDANELLRQIAKLNREVIAVQGAGDDATDFQDERDRLVNQLSEIMDVRAFIDGRGVLNVFTADYKFIAGEYAEVLRVDATNDAVSISSGAISSVGGQLGALQQVAATEVPNKLRQLSAIAQFLAARFNTPQPNGPGIQLFVNSATSTAPPAPPPLLTVPPFSGAIAINPTYRTLNAADLNARLRVGDANAATASPSDVAGATRANTVLMNTTENYTAVGITGLSGTLNYRDAASAVVIQTAQAQSAADTRVAELTTFDTQYRQLIASKSEVNLDEEQANIITLQNLYQANARVIQTTQTMLDELLALVGR